MAKYWCARCESAVAATESGECPSCGAALAEAVRGRMTTGDWCVGIVAYVVACSWWVWHSGDPLPTNIVEAGGFIGGLLGFSVWAVLFAFIAVRGVQRMRAR